MDSEKKQKINLNKIDRMASLSFQNSLRLHFDSILLYKKGSYPSSFFLSVLALEELGKFYQLDHFIYHSRIDEFMDTDWLLDIFYHKSKQNWFFSENRFDLPKRLFNEITIDKLEKEKQNSVYVGLPRHKKNIDLNGKINNPNKMTSSKAKSNITLLHNCFLQMCLMILTEVGCFDSDETEKYITKKLIIKLDQSWQIRMKKFQKYENQLRKMLY